MSQTEYPGIGKKVSFFTDYLDLHMKSTAKILNDNGACLTVFVLTGYMHGLVTEVQKTICHLIK